MFMCPVRFKIEKSTTPNILEPEVIRDFFISKGTANHTVALLLTSNDRKQKPNICLEEIFWYNDTGIDTNF